MLTRRRSTRLHPNIMAIPERTIGRPMRVRSRPTSEKLDSELTRLRSHFVDLMLKIESLERELVMSKDECVIFKDKCESMLSEGNILVTDNKRMNANIDA